jgi:hypothetical protein
MLPNSGPMPPNSGNFADNPLSFDLTRPIKPPVPLTFLSSALLERLAALLIFLDVSFDWFSIDFNSASFKPLVLVAS